MKTKNNRIVQRGLVLLMVVAMVSCNLDVQVKSPNVILPSDAGGAPPPESLSQIYAQLNNLTTDQGDWFGMQEHTTDEMMGPTRGTDWDDFGTWRKLHLHTWDGTHNQVVTAWNNIQAGLFQTTLLAESAAASPADAAAAKFLRSFWAFQSIDMYGVLQHRPATAKILDLPQVYSRSEAVDATITELEGAIADLPSFAAAGANRHLATKEAAYFLLAKLYLNKSVYKGAANFDPNDMKKVIDNIDAITASGKFSVATNYWDNFTWLNGTKSTENIFVRRQQDGGNMRWPTYSVSHYNMVPSGWNGFVVLSDFYDTFGKDGNLITDTLNDARAYYWLTDGSYSTVLGRNAGILTGLQSGPTSGTSHAIDQPVLPLKDRSGNPLFFTKTASLFFSTEARGYRPNKYPLDPNSLRNGGDGSNSTNDYVFFRYSDALLMKAEAILRGGVGTVPGSDTPLSLVNSIRANRNVAALGSVDLAGLLVERGRELYLEAVRRTDLIRFGKFNDPTTERANASDASRKLFPIPNIALSSNPNLKQNDGY